MAMTMPRGLIIYATSFDEVSHAPIRFKTSEPSSSLRLKCDGSVKRMGYRLGAPRIAGGARRAAAAPTGAAQQRCGRGALGPSAARSARRLLTIRASR